MASDFKSLDKKLSYLAQMKEYLSNNPELSIAELQKIAKGSKKQYESFKSELNKIKLEFDDQKKELEKIIGSYNREYK